MRHKVNEKIIELRKNAHLTQQQLADVLNVSGAAVSKWETGVSVPDIDMLCALADFFQVSMDTLLNHKPCQNRAILFLNDGKGEEEACRILQRHGILVCGTANTLSDLTKLHAEAGNVDYLIVITLSELSDYVSAKLNELAVCHNMKHLVVNTLSEEQIGTLLEIILNNFTV